MVRFRLALGSREYEGDFSFNPTMVRFRRRHQRHPAPRRLCFNPTMVRFRLTMPDNYRRDAECFNPTMVRFRRVRVGIPAQQKMFQSHNGSIQTRTGDRLRRRHPWFQSHNGSIQTRTSAKKSAAERRFNPTMVRFRQIHIPLSAYH